MVCVSACGDPSRTFLRRVDIVNKHDYSDDGFGDDSGKKHTQPRSHLEQMPAVPFPLGPDNREDQSLPPEIPLHSRKRQVVGAGGGHGDSRGRSGRSGKRERSGGRGGLGVAAGNGVDERSVFSGDEGTQMTKDAEDFESRVKVRRK